MFGYQGEPQKDLLHCPELIVTQPLLKANLPITTWTDGTTTYKFSFGTPPQRDQFVVDVNGTQHHIFCYDITPDRMFFHMEWPTPGANHSGVINGHEIHLGAQTLVAENSNAELTAEDDRQPVLNLEGTWTSSGHNDMILTKLKHLLSII